MIIKDRSEYAREYVPACNRLLDIGCDYGDFSIRYLAKAKRVYAVDQNREVISAAKKKHSSVIFRVASAEKLPFRDSFFDVVTFTDCFEHVADEKKAISEIYRVLKPGGSMIFSVPNKGMFQLIDAFNMKFYFPDLYRWFKGKRYDPGIYQEAPWHRHYSLRELQAFFRRRFEIVRYHRGGLIVWPMLWLLDASLYWKFFKKTPAQVRKAHNFISSIDYSIPYGPMAFHIILVAISLKSQTHEAYSQ
jgi:ubiquinone/menaquinone biosynthesis C-methylase UbiE